MFVIARDMAERMIEAIDPSNLYAKTTRSLIKNIDDKDQWATETGPWHLMEPAFLTACLASGTPLEAALSVLLGRPDLLPDNMTEALSAEVEHLRALKNECSGTNKAEDQHVVPEHDAVSAPDPFSLDGVRVRVADTNALAPFILDGDRLVVDEDLEPQTGDCVWAVDEAGASRLLRLESTEDGCWGLTDNPNFSGLPVKLCRIEGVVTRIIRDLTKR